MESKTLPYKKRVDKNNKRGNSYCSYLNHRFNLHLESYAGTDRDKVDGQDFGDSTRTYQGKWRESEVGEDFIYESDKYIPQPDGTFVHEPGRDARGRSDYTVIKPKGQDRLVFTKTSLIKKLAGDVVSQECQEWETCNITAYNGVDCFCISLPDTYLHSLWEQANKRKNVLIHTSEIYCNKSGRAVKIYFKIDEGEDRVRYAKFLFFIPTGILPEKVMNLLPGESLSDRLTWVRHETIL